jgi:hypothetical protein
MKRHRDFPGRGTRGWLGLMRFCPRRDRPSCRRDRSSCWSVRRRGIRLTTAADGNEARYPVRERLA